LNFRSKSSSSNQTMLVMMEQNVLHLVLT